MMLYPHLRVEFSYSSVLLVLWVLLLAFYSWTLGPWVQGVLVLLLTMSAVTSPHGNCRLLFPLMLLSERLLEDAMSVEHCHPEFYASTLLSYLTLVVCGRERKGQDILYIVLKVLVDAVVGLLVLYLMSKDSVVSVGACGFVVCGFIFFVTLRHKIGENEAVFVASFVGFYVCDTVINSNVNGEGALASDRGYGTTKMHVVGRAAVLVSICQTVVLFVSSWCGLISKVNNSKSSERTISTRKSTFLYFVSLSVILVWTYRALIIQLNEEPVFWLWNFITSSSYRLSVMVAWLFFIPTSVACVNFYTKGLRTTARRKLFHLIAVCAFTPVAVKEPEFLALAISVATGLAILVEVARFYKVYGHSLINEYVHGHIDQRDSIKGVVRTHIYLIYGLGLSMILYYRHENLTPAKSLRILELSVNVVPGVVALGIVDATAGIVGSTFLLTYRRALGRYLNNALFTEKANYSITHKTTTGTLAGVVCGSVFWFVVLVINYTAFDRVTCLSFVFVFICSLAECFIDGIDNLQLPLVVHGMILSIFAMIWRIPFMWE